jgi:hypothetical protein
MKRQHQILAGVLLIQILISVLVFWPKPASTETGEAVFPDLAADDVVMLRVTDDTGNEIALQRTEAGWVLPDAGNYPVLEGTVTQVLEKIAGLQTGSLVTRSDTSHKQLQVAEDEFVRRLLLETADGDTHTLYLGSAPRYTATHFRVAGETDTYLTTDLSTWDLNVQPNQWIDTAYTQIDQEAVISVMLENGQGTFTLVRDENGENWTLADLAADEQIATSSTNALVRNVTNMTLSAPLGTEAQPEYRMDEPNARISIETPEGTQAIVVGAEDEGGYVAKSSESPYYVRVAEYTVQPAVENARQDFLLEPEPTPTPAP